MSMRNKDEGRGEEILSDQEAEFGKVVTYWPVNESAISHVGGELGKYPETWDQNAVTCESASDNLNKHERSPISLSPKSTRAHPPASVFAIFSEDNTSQRLRSISADGPTSLKSTSPKEHFLACTAVECENPLPYRMIVPQQTYSSLETNATYCKNTVARHEENTLTPLKTTDVTPDTNSLHEAKEERLPELCRICQDEALAEKVVSPCFCSGTLGSVHISCLNTWLQLTSRTSCELCGYPFPVTWQPASLRDYFRNPRANMDLPNLFCDIAFLLVLTPLLVSSVHLSSTGSLRYESLGKAGSVCAVVTLLVALFLVYVTWACLAVVYHVRVWRAWSETHGVVSKLTEGLILAGKADPHKELPGTNQVGNISALKKESHLQSRNSATPADTMILLAPMNRLSNWMKANSKISSSRHNSLA